VGDDDGDDPFSMEALTGYTPERRKAVEAILNRKRERERANDDGDSSISLRHAQRVLDRRKAMVTDDEPIHEMEAQDRIKAAFAIIGTAPGSTVPVNVALEAARKVILYAVALAYRAHRDRETTPQLSVVPSETPDER